MARRKTIAALMYDFDKTLCTKDMQEYNFIPNLGMTAKQFWNESGTLAQNEKMDPILAYMYLMIQKANAAQQPIRRQDFVAAGKNIEFFPGVLDWFDRINAFGEQCGVSVEHYIISSGVKEIIEGTQLKGKFKKIYASEFHYDPSGKADWPKLAVNYTGKTQFLFSHMIYIGDGLTDVPCMKLVKLNGGKSIAVFQNRKRKQAEQLLHDKRVDFITPANYSAGSELETIVQEIIRKIAACNVLAQRHARQFGTVK